MSAEITDKDVEAFMVAKLAELRSLGSSSEWLSCAAHTYAADGPRICWTCGESQGPTFAETTAMESPREIAARKREKAAELRRQADEIEAEIAGKAVV